ncbi:hypothetical protein IMZ48_41255 [Candidatus Bathyarchaeota archaeon]|nr:hypothetical protein [Candidatus Bathyarchaeota archaeon]
MKLGNAEGWRGFTFKTLEEGAATTVYAAFDPALRGKCSSCNHPEAGRGLTCCVADHNGAYLQDCRLADPWKDTVRPWATSPLEAEKLWKLSEKLVGQEFRY